MNKRKKYPVSILVLVLAFIIISCKKYDEGGRVAQTKKNLINRWTLDKVYKDQEDITSDIVVRSFTEEYSSGGLVARSYINKKRDTLTSVYLEEDDTLVDYGNWLLDDFEPIIYLTSLDTVFNFAKDTMRNKKAYILRLDRKEFWYTFQWKWKDKFYIYQLNFKLAEYDK